MFQLFYVFWFKIPCSTKNPPNITVDETIVEKLSLKRRMQIVEGMKTSKKLKKFSTYLFSSVSILRGNGEKTLLL